MLNWIKLTGSLTVVLVLFAAATPARADKAGLMLFPTRFVLGEKERNVAIDIINKGNARGSYRIELIDMKMPETGAIRELDNNEADPNSIIPFARISPRRAVITPDSSQQVRILLRRPRDLPDGEYRSHLKVTLTEDNLDALENEKPTNNMSIKIKPRLAFTVPIIVRQGNTHFTVSIDDAHVYYSDRDKAREKPIARVNFSLQGNQSSMGDIKISYIDSSGKSTVVDFQPGIAIYRETKKRIIDFPLTLPEGVNLTPGGELQITYLGKVYETEGGGELLAEKTVKL